MSFKEWMIVILFFIFLIFIGIKMYTKRRVEDIDGMNGVIKQDLSKGVVLGHFGK